MPGPRPVGAADLGPEADTRRRRVGLGLVAAGLTVWVMSTMAQSEPLYQCADDTTTEAAGVGVTVCDGAATPALTERAETDNLQVRDGALVAALDNTGVSAEAGLQVGDLIYRVGGVDVEDADTARARLGRVGPTSDTVVNFLRGGRPYRVKMRRN